jgi:membrane protease subunit HflC
LEAYKTTFSKKSDVMVVDPSSDFFKALRGSGGGSAPAPKK